MGMDPEAVLFYGIPFIREDLPDEDWYDKVEEYVQTLEDVDCPQPYTEYDNKRDEPKVDPEYAAAWKKWRAVLKKWQPHQCRMGYRGSGDYYEPYLYVVASRTKVEWAEVSEVTTERQTEEWDRKLKECCDAVGLPYSQPKWYLAAYYG